MKESRRTFLSVVGIYAAGSWVVLQVIDVLNQNLGLPPWAFSLALVFLLIGLPIVAATAWLQGRGQNHGALDSEDPTGLPTGPHKLFTWRNAALAGLGAMALWGIFATAWMVRERRDESNLSRARSSARRSYVARRPWRETRFKQENTSFD